MSDAPTIILVGHCRPDEFMLRSAITRVLPDAAVETVHDDAGLDDHVAAGAVLLVNRVLDGRFTETSGIDLIRRLGETERAPIQFLISDIAEAQVQAAAAGARPGFGKRELYDAETGRKLREAAGSIN